MSLPALCLLAYFVYLLARVFYRLYCHTLSRFPGPRIAAATSWYEGYYEIVHKGQYSRQISKLHDVYGPIVRVTPDELHIRDPYFYDQVYAKNVHLDKEGWDKRFGCAGGLLPTVNAEQHKRRRAALAPMFSRRSILDFIHIIHRHVDTLSVRMQEFEADAEPLNLSHAFPALTGDIIMDYFFGFNYNQLKHPEFESFHDAFIRVGGVGHIATQFPMILPILDCIPDRISGWLQPAVKPVLKFKQDNRNHIARTLKGEDIKSNDAKKTIFQEIVGSKLPDSDKTQKRLEDEAQIIIGGGVETTAFSLSTAAFHIISTPRIYERLHKELVEAFPNRDDLDLAPLEKMPYFKAIIMETARMSYGLSARNPRTHKTPLQYKEWVIPAYLHSKSLPYSMIHLPIASKLTPHPQSMTIPEVSHDETLFPSSRTFIPERWLNDPKTADGIPLERFMVSFGRGTRNCLGINLAYVELYLTLGMLFRNYKFELHESDVSDVELGHDFFIPVAKLDSKGLRVLVRSTED